MEDTYIEHTRIADDGGVWSVVDASTIGGPRAHDDVVSVSLHGGGVSVSQWMLPAEAEAFAQAILAVVASHRARRSA